MRLQADRFLHHVRLSAKGFLPDDNYFHLLPGRQKCVTFAPWGNATRPLRATIEAVNLMGELSVDSKPSAP
jgi:beta-mannosidase